VCIWIQRAVSGHVQASLVCDETLDFSPQFVTVALPKGPDRVLVYRGVIKDHGGHLRYEPMQWATEFVAHEQAQLVDEVLARRIDGVGLGNETREVISLPADLSEPRQHLGKRHLKAVFRLPE
jgi:hypothetical protein